MSPGLRPEFWADDGEESDDYDPWKEVEDPEGVAHYRTLGITTKATPREIKEAYYRLAKVHHPDKGGSAELFSKILTAYEVLGDPEKRKTYDRWAKELQWRYIPGVSARADGGADIIFEELERRAGGGLEIDAMTQLVLLCEVCRRPASKNCFICGMPYCEFCSLKKHWKGEFGLHWPMYVDKERAKKKAAEREAERKRIEDEEKLLLMDPNYRNARELRDMDEFVKAAEASAKRVGRHTRYDRQLAKYYCWSQMESHVFVAVRVPTGFHDKAIKFEVTESELLLQPEGSPPVIQRAFDYPVGGSQALQSSAIETLQTECNRLLVAKIPKGIPGQKWRRLFKGDSDGVRCLEPIYRLIETQEENTLEFDLPFWIEDGDVTLDITETNIRVEVAQELSFERTFWKNPDDMKRRVLAVGECDWSLDTERSRQGEKIKRLVISLVKPPLPENDRLWKKGVRQDNQAIERREGPGMRYGYRFFADDEDYYGLEPIVMACCFAESGRTFSPSVPWDKNSIATVIEDKESLPQETKEYLKLFAGSDFCKS